MDNAQKAIMIGVGLFITIIIIAAVMLITGIGQDLLNQGTDKAGNISSSLTTQETAAYDNTNMSGAQVISAVKKYYNDSKMVVMVGTTCYTPYKADTNGKKTQNTAQPSLGNLTTPGETGYIPSAAQYKATLLKTTDGGVYGIQFSKI